MRTPEVDDDDGEQQRERVAKPAVDGRRVDERDPEARHGRRGSRQRQDAPRHQDRTTGAHRDRRRSRARRDGHEGIRDRRGRNAGHRRGGFRRSPPGRGLWARPVRPAGGSRACRRAERRDRERSGARRARRGARSPRQLQGSSVRRSLRDAARAKLEGVQDDRADHAGQGGPRHAAGALRSRSPLCVRLGGRCRCRTE